MNFALIFMETDDIINLAKRDRKGRELSDKLTQDSSTNAVYELAGIEGRLNDPRLAPLLTASPDMTPARQRTQIEQSLGEYQKEIINAVVENIDNAVKGLADENIAKYLLASPLKPAAYGDVSDEWVKKYASARDADLFLKSPEKEMPKKFNEYIKNQIDSLKREKLSSGLISALVWVYNNHPEIAQNLIMADAEKNVKSFVKELNVVEGRNYITSRANKLEGKNKTTEAYRIGQALAQ